MLCPLEYKVARSCRVSGQIDPYKILGVSTDATLDEVRRAYRRAATKYHPDAGGDAWAFQQVQQAFAMLREKFENSSTTTSSNNTTPNARKNASTSTQQTDHRSTGSSTRDNGPAGNSSRTSAEQPRSGRSGRSEQSGHAPNSSGSSSDDTTAKKPVSLRDWLLGAPLMLHDETSYFVLANFMDLVMTGILLRVSAVEANPIANYFYREFGFIGMVGLKIASVAIVVVIAQVIAKRSRTKARLLLIGGTTIVAAVVVYSMFLARGHILGR